MALSPQTIQKANFFVKRPPPATELALKYGVWNDPPILGLGKSGLTPYTPEPQKKDTWRGEGAWRYWEVRTAVEELQANRMSFWTMRELKVVNAFAAYWDQGSAGLANPIHPNFELKRWEEINDQYFHLAPIPVGHGIEGFWDAHNPVVWEIMQPGLQLASKLMENFHIWPFWDALIHSEMHKIYEEDDKGNLVHRMYESYGLYKIKRRTPEQIENDRETTRDFILRAADNYDFSFGDGLTCPRDDMPSERAWLGVSFQDLVTSRTWIRCDYHFLAPLLVHQLTKGEELVIHWNFGTMLVHELAHALWIQRCKVDPVAASASHEPYFEDEAVSELGNSLTAFIFGGVHFPLQLARDYLGPYPTPAVIRSQWPTEKIPGSNPPLYKEGEERPQEYAHAIPIDYFWLTQQEPFWNNHVPAFGVESLYFEPLVVGKGLNGEHKVVNSRRNVNPVPSDETIQKFPEIWNALRTLHSELSRNWKIANAQLKELDEAIDRDLHQHNQQDLMPPPAQQMFELCLPPARHEEFTALLIEYRVQLAFHTMDFSMPELTLLGHINRMGVTANIEPEEWRQYLKYLTHTKKELLTFIPYPGGGCVNVNFQHGWPSLLVPPRKPDIQPPDEHIKLMHSHMKQKGDAYYYWNKYPDTDADSVRMCIEGVWNVQLDSDAFEVLIEWFIYLGEYWRAAPPGIVRLRYKIDVQLENKVLEQEKPSDNAKGEKPSDNAKGEKPQAENPAAENPAAENLNANEAQQEEGEGEATTGPADTTTAGPATATNTPASQPFTSSYIPDPTNDIIELIKEFDQLAQLPDPNSPLKFSSTSRISTQIVAAADVALASGQDVQLTSYVANVIGAARIIEDIMGEEAGKGDKMSDTGEAGESSAPGETTVETVGTGGTAEAGATGEIGDIGSNTAGGDAPIAGSNKKIIELAKKIDALAVMVGIESQGRLSRVIVDAVNGMEQAHGGDGGKHGFGFSYGDSDSDSDSDSDDDDGDNLDSDGDVLMGED